MLKTMLVFVVKYAPFETFVIVFGSCDRKKIQTCCRQGIEAMSSGLFRNPNSEPASLDLNRPNPFGYFPIQLRTN